MGDDTHTTRTYHMHLALAGTHFTYCCFYIMGSTRGHEGPHVWKQAYLITAIPAVTHEVKRKLLLAQCVGCNELQLGCGFLLQGDTLDDQAGVLLFSANQQPPILLFSPRVPDVRGYKFTCETTQ